VKAKSLKNRNDVSDLQFIIQFVCDGKKRTKTKMKKLKFKHIIFHYKLKRYIKIESPYGQVTLQNKVFTASNKEATHQQNTKHKIERITP
jgi:hypothetical protein